MKAHIEQVGLGPAEERIRVVDQRTLVMDKRGVIHAVVGSWSRYGGGQEVLARDVRGDVWHGVRDPLKPQ